MFLLLITLAIAQPQVPAPPQVPPVVELFPSYRQTSGPVVVFVRCEPRKVQGVKVCHEPKVFADTDGAAVVVSPDGTKRVDLPATASDSEIRQAAGLERPLARPFSRPGERRIADDDGKAAGPWPKTIAKIDGMELYTPARFTQAIAQTKFVGARDFVPTQTPVHRSNLKMEWQVPGGMEGVDGWRSDLYKHIPKGWQREWTARLPVLNSFGNFQYELGWTRAYPDGTVFVDVLSNEGKVFEARIAEKQEGKWERYVAYRDADAYPSGYSGLTKTCTSCHQQAGSGGYGVGLVPGADTIISDPFPALER